MSKSRRSWLNVAVKIAEDSNCRSKHGSIITSGGRILATGINRSRLNNAYYNWFDGPAPSEHAEAAAIRKCRGMDLSNAVLYVARVNRQGEEMYSRPCRNCMELIKDAGIRRVVYTEGDGSYGRWP